MSKDRRRARHKPRPLLVAVLGWFVLIVLLSGVGALLAVGANGPADPRLAPLVKVRDPAVAAEFGEIAFRVTPAAGSAIPGSTEWCALLADSDLERQKGLMGRSDLGGYDAMVFRFENDTDGTFFMRNVPIPLSIAWFDASGLFVSSTDMEPCPPDQQECPTYPPGGVYRFALETPKGGLERLGVAPGSVLSLGGACTSPAA